MNIKLQTICTFFTVVWMMCCVHKFRMYWAKHSKQWKSANELLQSDVCLDTELRIKIGEFDQCQRAESIVSFSPFQTALFAIGEDMHICGHQRCELLYVDITDRLTLVLCIFMLLVFLTTLKTYRAMKRDIIYNQGNHWSLPMKNKDL